MSDHPYIFYSTLRDGEQVPGCRLYTVEKIEDAKALEQPEADNIKADLPASSPGDPSAIVRVHLNAQTVNNLASGGRESFEINPYKKEYPSRGPDDEAHRLSRSDEIRKRRATVPLILLHRSCRRQCFFEYHSLTSERRCSGSLFRHLSITE